MLFMIKKKKNKLRKATFHVGPVHVFEPELVLSPWVTFTSVSTQTLEEPLLSLLVYLGEMCVLYICVCLVLSNWMQRKDARHV
jgi:hypothetical protein